MIIDLLKIKKIVSTSVFISMVVCISVFASSKKDTASAIDFEKAFKSEIGNTVLAQVGDKKITVREFLASYEFGPAFTKREKDSKKRYLKYMIDEKLLALDGYKKGFADSARVKNLLSAIKGDLATDELFNADIFDKIKISKPELDTALEEKQYTYQVKWLYAPQKDSLEFYLSGLRHGVSFDSLFNMQLKDSVYADQRSMKINKFKLRMQNLEMFNTVDTLKANQISNPIHGSDGWYIVKLIDIWKNVIVNQTELSKEDYDATNALKLNKSDHLSDLYVKNIMLEHNPVIQARTFDILRSYMGNSVLPKKKFTSWKLDERMQNELKYYDTLTTKQFGRLKLVALSAGSLSLDDFLNWYRMREQYLKFNEADFNSFSASLEQLVWQMVRDHLLIQRAYAQGFQNKETVKQQLNWWQDKIVYAVVRDKMANTIGLNIEIPSSLDSKYDNKKQSLIEKTFRKLQQLRKEYKVKINENVLKEISVHDYDNPRTIDTYIVKKGGTFPHPAFPSIDFAWQTWE
jgi:hypothetical protein